MTVAKIAVENAVFHFDKAFDYLVPEALAGQALPGCRVLVPFGGANSRRQGILLALEEREPQDKIKSVLAVLDKAPLLSNQGIQLVYWLKERYFCTLFEAAKLLLPTGISLKIKTEYALARPLDQIELEALSETERQAVLAVSRAKSPPAREKLLKTLGLAADSPVPEKLCKAGVFEKRSGAVRNVGDASVKMVRLAECEPLPKLTARQADVYRVLKDVGGAALKELCYFAGVTPVVVDALVKKGLARYEECEVYRNPYAEVQDPASPGDIVLSAEQERAFDGLSQKYRGGGGVSLLYGVTGSGKTSVFMRLIDEVKKAGRGIIVMVPEISLTPQTVSLFHRRYGRSVAVFHSGLSLAERLDEWKRVRSGQAQIAVGTRSAVFAPFSDIGLIVMDEEQESTYKSESSPRYHAREVARYRCAQNRALLVLASATPSMESFYLAKTGRYGLLMLPERYGEAKLPQVTVADMNEEMERGNRTIFSTALLEALEENLKIQKQSIVLLNRRGYNTFVSCKACGHVITCPHCSISLTYHSANQRLMCHYCGYSVPFTKECPVCHENSVHYAGFGTQRAEQQLQELLPQARILRIDTDSTLSRFAYEKKLRCFSEGEYDIIVGTQMVAKGLDFENVTLVGVLSADQALYSDDYRSYERAFGLLTQVVGRSGRGKYAGRAIIQTFTPENKIIALAANQDYLQFYRDEIGTRKAMLYPPFSDICMIGFVGMDEAQVRQASGVFLNMFTALAGEEYPEQPLRVLSPSPASVGKVSNKYRYKLIIKCRNGKKFREMIARLLTAFSLKREFARVTAFADINPDSIL